MGAKEFEMDALGFHFPSHIEMMFHWKNTSHMIEYLLIHTRNHKFYVDITYRCGVTATLSDIWLRSTADNQVREHVNTKKQAAQVFAQITKLTSYNLHLGLQFNPNEWSFNLYNTSTITFIGTLANFNSCTCQTIVPPSTPIMSTSSFTTSR